MTPMTEEEIREHKKNPNITLTLNGEFYVCGCGCNVFHQKDYHENYYCNLCGIKHSVPTKATP